MSHLAHFRALAQYNSWMNGRLFELSAEVSPADLRRDMGAFFRSIHGTLNHLLLVDRIWLRRFRDAFPSWNALRTTPLVEEFESLADILFEDLEDLRKQRVETDAAITAWVRELDESELSAVFRYANSKGVKREHPVWFGMAHLFNHQTHHRGQATTLLHQLGKDPGMTDFLVVEHIR